MLVKFTSNTIFLFLLSLLATSTVFCDSPKIVGLVPVRNEEKMIEPCLKALSMCTDAIVVLDDCSDDHTVEVVRSLQEECKVEKIITKEKWYRDEPGDRNKLLQAGRDIGGTHFIVIDADEMFTSNLLKDNLLRNKILELKAGDYLCITWINLWRSVDCYRYDYSVWSGQSVNAAFCDDKACFYDSGFIHTSRSPSNLLGNKIDLVLDGNDFDFLNKCLKDYGKKVLVNTKRECFDKENMHLQRYFKDQINNNKKTLKSISGVSVVRNVFFPDDGTSQRGCYRQDFTAGLMHFQFVNWENLLAKQSWYRCLEKIRNPNIDVKQINAMYGESKQESNLRVVSCPKDWFSAYNFFDRSIYEENESWQKKQIKKWFKEYGKQYFKDLDIWDVDWNV